MISRPDRQRLLKIIIFGELSRHLSDELKAQYQEIPWKTISGLRNRLVHDYEETNWSIIAGVIEDDICPLLDSCSAILKQDSEASNASGGVSAAKDARNPASE
jgi:uncharacterized protein with HEPN domain